MVRNPELQEQNETSDAEIQLSDLQKKAEETYKLYFFQKLQKQAPELYGKAKAIGGVVGMFSGENPILEGIYEKYGKPLLYQNRTENTQGGGFDIKTAITTAITALATTIPELDLGGLDQIALEMQATANQIAHTTEQDLLAFRQANGLPVDGLDENSIPDEVSNKEKYELADTGNLRIPDFIDTIANQPYIQKAKEWYSLDRGPKPGRIPTLIAFIGYQKLINSGKVQNKRTLTIVDFSKPQDEDRFFVLELDSPNNPTNISTKYHEKAGQGLGVNAFSNVSGSNKSSLGFTITAQGTRRNNRDTWTGLLMDGFEESNSEVAERGIHIHPGSLSGSKGCITIPGDESNVLNILHEIQGGSLVFTYYPDIDYLQDSQIIADINPDTESVIV